MNRPVMPPATPTDEKGKNLRASEYYGEYVFDIQKAREIPNSVKKELAEVSKAGKPLTKEMAKVVADAVLNWSLAKGATHFCHWFHPLTGSTAEKHDSFIDFDGNVAIEKFSASQLMKGEPDASSFPHGGSRATFEARGYTAWDMASPMFLIPGTNGKTLCIPTAFVSYHGDALDIKTPLLRSSARLNKVATKFLKLSGKKDTENVIVTCGAEQEYFLIDKNFYYLRPDLVMTNRSLFGSLTSRNQQLEDHYFGTIPSRVLACMEELEIELYKLGIPAKTRHNEVAPAQFEIAQIYSEANLAADQNQLVMATLRSVADKHGFVALLHEKPFAGINGSGKHLNWSMADNTGYNLLEPGKDPHQNFMFLGVLAVIVEAVNRHAAMLRLGIASHGNDHRLGANEAPPSIISIFLGDTLDKILEAIANGKSFKPSDMALLDLGAPELANLLKDNTDRNRTSPFAFTGNKFEFRACGSSAAIGFPLTILNSAVAEVFDESNAFLEKELAAGKKVDEAIISLIQKWINKSHKVIFNGDNYTQEWVDEAKRRGLPNYRTTPESLAVLKEDKYLGFLVNQGVFTADELKMRYNVLIERYIKYREIEFTTFNNMFNQFVLPAAVEYKNKLSTLIRNQKKIGLESEVELDVYKKLDVELNSAFKDLTKLLKELKEAHHGGEEKAAMKIALELMPLSVKVANSFNKIEEIVPETLWVLPSYYDMLFIR
ncbi:MAG: glutamine synthetase III [Bacteriovoracaceae bacterium]